MLATDRAMREIIKEILGETISNRMRKLGVNKWKIECGGEPQQRFLNKINESSHPITWGAVEADHIIVKFQDR